MSRRASQIASEVHRAVQAVFDRGLQDPRVSDALLTVTEVHVSEDFRNATVMVSVMPESREKLAMHGLDAAARHIRRQIGTLIEIRQMPELAFRLDRSVKKQAEVLEAIARATTEREAVEKARAEAGLPPLSDGPSSSPPPGESGTDHHRGFGAPPPSA